MLFNSLSFLFFIIIALGVFYVVPARMRWAFLLAVSYVFYAFWSVKAVLVLLAVSGISYLSGRMIQSARQKEFYLFLGVSLNVAVLIFFKYADFIIENINHFRADNLGLLHILLPVGISFYIFQAISYLVDIYLGKTEAETHIGLFFLYLSFFPKLLQGPIERAQDLLPQLKALPSIPKVDYDRNTEGWKLILTGLVKKVVIADRLAVFVNMVFGDVTGYSGLSLVAAVYMYTFQLYFDFAGYTDMARGLGKLFGIELSENFNAPYLSTNIQEFWRRWHMTFSFWLRDYLFTPLMAQFRGWAGAGAVLAALLTFTICGVWHGASWGFVVFGIVHGIYISLSLLTLKAREKFVKRHAFAAPAVKAWRIFWTFQMIAFAFIFFRANSLTDAGYIIHHLFAGGSAGPFVEAYSLFEIIVILAALLMIIGPWQARFMKPAFKGWGTKLYYGALTNLALIFGVKSYAPFIYFKF